MKTLCDSCNKFNSDFSGLQSEGDWKNICLDCDHKVNGKSNKYIVIDWMYNIMFDGRQWDDFEDADCFLSEFLDPRGCMGDGEYSELRGEYEIVELTDEYKIEGIKLLEVNKSPKLLKKLRLKA